MFSILLLLSIVNELSTFFFFFLRDRFLEMYLIPNVVEWEGRERGVKKDGWKAKWVIMHLVSFLTIE